MFPIGTKTKNYIDKISITAQLQSEIDKEINKFYNHIPLKKESFDGIKPKNKTKKIRKF